MKKITLLAVAFVAISFASCKKTHTCTCTSGGVSTSIALPKQTSAQAKTSCDFYATSGETCVVS